MVQAFLVSLEAGFSALLAPAVMGALLRRFSLTAPIRSLYAGLFLSLPLSALLAYALNNGWNGPLWEALLCALAGFVSLALGVRFFCAGGLQKAGGHSPLFLVGMFLLAFAAVCRESMTLALLIFQVDDASIQAGIGLGSAAALLTFLWIPLSRVFESSALFRASVFFLFLFAVQNFLYAFHEWTETGFLPSSQSLHEATEFLSPDGAWGKWFPIASAAMGLFLSFLLSFRRPDAR